MNDWKVLLIDDDISQLKMLEARLKRGDGYQVLLAQDGKLGLELARAEQPDLILLDWEMPGINGIDVLKVLKSDDKTRDIAVVMLTGRKLVGELEQAFALKALGYLIKPITLSKVSDKVAEILRARTSMDEGLVASCFRILRGNL